MMRFELSSYDAVTIRSNPTTQVAIGVAEWPGNTFLLWLPEALPPLWHQWTPEEAHQDFRPLPGGGLVWKRRQTEAAMEARLRPEADALALEVAAANLADEPLCGVGTQNCLHFSEAPDFACDDGSRIYIRVDGRWRSIASLNPSFKAALYCRAGRRETIDWADRGGQPPEYLERPEVDHPLIVYLSTDGSRTVGTVSEDCDFVFYNSSVPYLLCIHSMQRPVATLPPGQTARFLQKIYFADGGVDACAAAYEADVAGGRIQAS